MYFSLLWEEMTRTDRLRKRTLKQLHLKNGHGFLVTSCQPPSPPPFFSMQTWDVAHCYWCVHSKDNEDGRSGIMLTSVSAKQAGDLNKALTLTPLVYATLSLCPMWDT